MCVYLLKKIKPWILYHNKVMHFQINFLVWKLLYFCLSLAESLTERLQLISSQHWFRWWLGNQLVTAIVWTNYVFTHCSLHDDISTYHKTSNIRRTVAGNKIVDHSDVVGASPVGAAPTTSSFSTWHLSSRNSAKKAARQYENLLSVGIWCVLY